MSTNTIWNSTLESFRESVAGAEPMPAGVAAAAVSATLGVSLLLKVLAIVTRRKSIAGNNERLPSLRQAAESESARLSQYADDDIAAYRAYLETRRKMTDNATPLHGTIQTPFHAAESALSSLELCADATGLVHGALLADLATAAILLEGAIRAMLLSVEVNLQQLPDGEISARCKEMREKSRQQLDSLLRQISTAEQTACDDAT